MPFLVSNVPDLSGKTLVITGGNSGIGFEAARVLAARHGRVVLACRDPGKMEEALGRLRGETPGATVEGLTLDLASLASIRAAANELASRVDRIDVLVNNAGVMAIPERQTADGFEMQFGTNHLGHFAFTGLLLEGLRQARVVTVSSILHRRGHIVWDDIPRPRKYDKDRAYSMSKLANVLFARELDRRFKKAGWKAMSLACHPGYAATNLQAVGPQMSGSKVAGFLMKVANAVLAQSAEAGALPTLWGAVGTDVEGGDYLGPASLGGLRGTPVRGRSNDESYDEAVAARLWERSKELTGVDYAGL